MKSKLATSLLGICLLASAGLAFHATQATAVSDTAPSYAEYRNERFGYALLVPAGMEVSEERSRGQEETIAFREPTTDRLFHVSALPYSQLDIALGTLAPAAAVSSDQPQHLGIVSAVREDIFKVWFTKDGVLYVVVTFPEDEEWLIDILKTWQFI